MNRQLVLSIVVLLAGSTLAADDPAEKPDTTREEAKLPDGSQSQADSDAPLPDTSWSVPDSVTVPVGGTGYLKVKIDRGQIKDDVQLEVAGLPTGLSVKGGPRRTLKRSEDDSDITFVLLADSEIEPSKERKITVNLVAGEKRALKTPELLVINYDLQTGSALVMGISIIAVLTLVTFCVWRVLTLPPVEVEEHLKGPLEIDTRDTHDAD